LKQEFGETHKHIWEVLFLIEKFVDFSEIYDSDRQSAIMVLWFLISWY
jgi:hypothetical protein